MSKKLYEESNIQDIADAIREKNGTENSYKVSDMSEAILDLPTTSANIQPLSVTENGVYNPPSGVNGYAPITVNVQGGSFSQKIMEQGQVSDTTNYMFANYADGVNVNQYTCLWVILYKSGRKIGSWAFSPIGEAYMYDDGGLSYKIKTTATGIGTTYYSGSYANLYVDVYGLVMPDA